MSDADSDDGRLPVSLANLLSKRGVIIVAVVGVVVLGAGISSTLIDSGQSVTATDAADGATVATSLSADTPTTVSFDGTTVGSGDIALDELELDAETGGSLTLSSVSTLDADSAPEQAPGNTTGYLSVDHDGDAELDSVTFTFSVDADRLASIGTDPGDVVLYRYNSGTWQSLETALVDESDGVYTYEAVSPGLSVFSISSASDETGDDDTDETDVDDGNNGNGDDPPSDETPDGTTDTPTSTPESTDTPTETPTVTATETPTSTATETSADRGDTGGSEPAPTTTLSVEAADESISNDRGDVDVAAGSITGTLAVEQPTAETVDLTITVDDGQETRQLRETSYTLDDEESVSLATILTDTRLLYATGSDADRFSVATDGATETETVTVTVTATVLNPSEATLQTVAVTDTVEIQVTNIDAQADGSGQSNPATS